MRLEGSVMRQVSILAEFWVFLRERKKFWLLPLVLVLLLLGLVIVLTANSAVAPFIYSVF
jgi:hypothetical protein